MTASRDEGTLRDSKVSLYEAAKAAIKDQEAKHEAERMTRLAATGRRRRVGVLGIIGVAGLALVFLQPVWLTGPKVVPQEPPPLAAASLRLTLIRERQRIFDYERQTGRLPATLQEAGGSAPEIRYLLDSTGVFRLVGQSGDSIIELRSSDSLTAFLGNSLLRVRDRGRP